MYFLRDKKTARLIAANLKRLMEDRKEPFTQVSLAAATNGKVTQSAISKILSAEREAKLSILIPLCKPLKCSLQDFVNEDAVEVLETSS
jgi:DNA-binding Xre family transcriptional regulator